MLIEIQSWLKTLTEKGGSTLHLQAGRPPLGRVDGALHPLSDASLDREALSRGLHTLFGETNGVVLTDLGDIGTAYAYRVNVAGAVGAVVRLLQPGPTDLSKLGVPEAAQSVFRETTDGLVLLAGRAKTGRSSTLAAMLADRVAESSVHAAWIGDPLVFRPPMGRGRVTTLVVDVDAPSVAGAIREAQRLDVDALFIDPLHDVEAADLALRFAETGRLVVATVTAHGIPDALWRLIDPLSGDPRKRANLRLSRAFRLALDHCLVPRAKEDGRLPAFGVLHPGAGAPVSLIREDKCHQLDSAAMVGKAHGMQSISQALLPHILAGDCTEGAALSVIPEQMHLLDSLRHAREEEG
jgi:twitching motility protein PilT